MRKEIDILLEYLPEQMSEDELNQLVDQVIGELNASSMKDMGQVMKVMSERTKGRADGKVISQIVRQKLA